ncbi:MAG TPA: DUF58 domain-containing protein [Anaerolineales bacterium]
MSRSILSLLTGIAFVSMVVCLPALWTIYTVRGSGRMEPERFVSLFAIAAAAGVLLFLPSLSVVAVIALLAVGLAWLWARYALMEVEYERSLDPPRLFPDDTSRLTLRLHNRKILPLSWFTVTESLWLGVVHSPRNLQKRLEFSAGMTVLENSDRALVTTGAAGSFQTYERTVTVTARRRGVYSLGPATIETGDPFSLFRRVRVESTRQEIVVYPRVYAANEIDFPFREALGEIKARQALQEDPTLLAGSREYRPGDPLRRIHWKSTARTGNLQVRVFDPSTTAQLMVVLNLRTYLNIWEGIGLERLEEVIRMAGSVALWALQHDFAVGMSSNGHVSALTGDHMSPRVSPSANPRQAMVLLEHLARLSFSSGVAAERVLLDEGSRLGDRASVLFVTAMMTPELIEALTSRQLAGRVSVLYCGRHAAPLVRGVPVYLAQPTGALRDIG